MTHEHHNQPSSPEQGKQASIPSWGDLAFGILARKLPPDITEQAQGKIVLTHSRDFITTNGDEVHVIFDRGMDLCLVDVTPASKPGHPYSLFITTSDYDANHLDIVIKDENGTWPLPDASQESIAGTLATMVPVSETRYLYADPTE